MPDRVQLVGGPLDGDAIVRPAGTYAWCAGTVSRLSALRVADSYARLAALPGRKPRYLHGGGASSRPRDGAALYVHDRAAGVMLYAGHRTVFCRSCGTYHPRCEGGREKRPCALGGDDAS